MYMQSNYSCVEWGSTNTVTGAWFIMMKHLLLLVYKTWILVSWHGILPSTLKSLHRNSLKLTWREHYLTTCGNLQTWAVYMSLKIIAELYISLNSCEFYFMLLLWNWVKTKLNTQNSHRSAISGLAYSLCPSTECLETNLELMTNYSGTILARIAWPHSLNWGLEILWGGYCLPNVTNYWCCMFLLLHVLLADLYKVKYYHFTREVQSMMARLIRVRFTQLTSSTDNSLYTASNCNLPSHSHDSQLEFLKPV